MFRRGRRRRPAIGHVDPRTAPRGPAFQDGTRLGQAAVDERQTATLVQDGRGLHDEELLVGGGVSPSVAPIQLQRPWRLPRHGRGTTKVRTRYRRLRQSENVAVAEVEGRRRLLVESATVGRRRVRWS